MYDTVPPDKKDHLGQEREKWEGLTDEMFQSWAIIHANAASLMFILVEAWGKVCDKQRWVSGQAEKLNRAVENHKNAGVLFRMNGVNIYKSIIIQEIRTWISNDWVVWRGTE